MKTLQPGSSVINSNMITGANNFFFIVVTPSYLLR